MSSHRPVGYRWYLISALSTLGCVVALLLLAARFAPWEFNTAKIVVRAQNGMTHTFPAPEVDPWIVPTQLRREVELSEEPRPRNVILMIGDGMGVGQVSSASAILYGPGGGLAVESAPVTGFVRTYAGNDLATDSAAASTAMATGFKAPKTAISILADGRSPKTLMEALKAVGMRTGVVTTSGLADATPAGFLVHAGDRYQYANIFSSILKTRHDVLMGGNWVRHHKAKHDREYLDLVDRVDELGSAAGYNVVQSETDLMNAQTPVFGLFPPRGDSDDDYGPDLTITTEFTLEALAKDEIGFFALIESEVTDSRGHMNSVAGVVDAVREFDASVAFAVEWAEERGDTLVLVTADHDTGGLGIVNGNYDDGVAEVRWTSDMHTALWVPLFAFGPGAEHFSGVIDNTDIGILIAKLLGIEDFPSAQP